MSTEEIREFNYLLEKCKTFREAVQGWGRAIAHIEKGNSKRKEQSLVKCRTELQRAIAQEEAADKALLMFVQGQVV